MKEFILTCVLEKLENKKTLKALEEEQDLEAFDQGIKSVKEKGYDTLSEVKRYLGLEKYRKDVCKSLVKITYAALR
jgi:hypothetical protein